MGEFQIQPRRFGIGFGDQIGGLGIVFVLGSDGILPQQFLITIRLGLGRGQRRYRIVIGGLIGARIDHEKKIALLDQLAFREVGRIDQALDARRHLHGGIGHHGAQGSLHHRHVAALDHARAYRYGVAAGRAPGRAALVEIPVAAHQQHQRDTADQVMAQR